MVKIVKPRAIICDIEGTTTSTRYWGECVVPFIKYNTKQCLENKWGTQVLMQLIDALRRSTNVINAEEQTNIPPIANKTKDKESIIKSIVDNIIYQLNNKRRGKSLQHFQLYVWFYGYQTDELKSHVFEDVSKSFNRWKKFLNIKIFTYSSSLYLSQKLLFSSTIKGNLCPLIDGYLDVETYGFKTSSESFTMIANKFDINTKHILFISDNPQELKAAKVTGCQVLLVIRPFNKELSDEEKQGFECIKSFNEIQFN
ncbi:enolase-phosphatase E1-like [Oppia nitens]|uniref:enolase-phosphatase E1-like n=1 Tax=Oppia nitens TaxID=1686743 RepID=UPI0023DC1606|nr:enolase-phosphatase E1-like [Oppia nitens]